MPTALHLEADEAVVVVVVYLKLQAVEEGWLFLLLDMVHEEVVALYYMQLWNLRMLNLQGSSDEAPRADRLQVWSLLLLNLDASFD